MDGDFVDVMKLGQFKCKINLDLKETAPEVELAYKVDVVRFRKDVCPRRG